MNKQQLELPLFEEWKTIEDYEDYQVSNFGRVKSLERIDNLGRTVKERILKPFTNEDGYKQVKLFNGGKEKTFKVHRLVAMAFIANPNNLPQVNHKDEVKANNHVSNLEWCTAKYNNNYGTRKEKVSKTKSGKLGKDCPNSKQIVQLTLGDDYIKTWDCMHDVERKLGYSQGNISKCCRGKRKSANGYKWCYA